MTDQNTPLTAIDFSSELEIRRARYSKVEREVDSLGRIIGVRRLKLSEQTKLTAMTPDLGGIDEVQNPEIPGHTMLVNQRAQYFLVAMVCEIAGAPIPFARNRAELDSILDRLDIEGLTAAGIACGRLFDGENSEDKTDKAKNSSGMPTFE